MARNAEVIQAWIDGQYAQAGHLHTNGRSLYSYEYCIAQLHRDEVVVLIRTGGHPMAGSMTTNRHRNAAERAAIEAGYQVRREAIGFARAQSMPR